MIRRPPRSPLFPSTPLFRSERSREAAEPAQQHHARGAEARRERPRQQRAGRCETDERHRVERSEEHTSELQSPCNLVCRLLLEKKKKKKITPQCKKTACTTT